MEPLLPAQVHSVSVKTGLKLVVMYSISIIFIGTDDRQIGVNYCEINNHI